MSPAIPFFFLSYDEILLNAVALEHFIEACRAAVKVISSEAPSALGARDQIAQQIEDAESLLTRINEARR